MIEKLTIGEIKNGIELSIENAFELIADAQLLFENERFARSYTLSQLAQEELGKSIMLYNFYMNLKMGERSEYDFKLFRKNFRNHKWKTYESIFIDLVKKGIGKTKSEEFMDIALSNFKKIQLNKSGHYDNLKNESLYVSLKGSSFHKPIDLFTKENVEKFMKESKAKIEFSSEHTLKWIRLDEKLGMDKEGVIAEFNTKNR